MPARKGRAKIGAAYAKSGVDIDSAVAAKELIKKHARSTFRPGVVTDIGFFSGLFQLSGYKDPVLASSTDGVGTKIRLAIALDKHDTIGIDLVNHCVNDIFTCGAEPLFFLDYIALGKMAPRKVESIVQGLSAACRAVNCALIGGETAEMPGMYAEDDYDLAGFIVGVVERDSIIDGKSIAAGDVLIGLPSTGLHTNGYSLARKVLGEDKASLNKFYPELGRTAGEALMEPHRCYFAELKPLLPMIKGMAHITGGGILDNLPRSLPAGLGARIAANAWAVPPIFTLIQSKGKIEQIEMYRVFNMGIGMILVCSHSDADQLLGALPEGRVIGKIVRTRAAQRVTVI